MLKIMVVDDEQELCDFLRDFFSSRGHEVLTVCDPAKVMDAVEKEKPQIVLLDIRMPVLNGIEVLKLIKAKHPAVKVIMVSALSEAAKKEEAKKYGADAYVEKPFYSPYLEKVVMIKIEELMGLRSGAMDE